MKTLPYFAAAALCLTSLAHAADSFEDRMKTAVESIQGKRSSGKEAFYSEVEKQGRALLKDFPDKADPYQMLIAAASNYEPEKAKAIYKEIVATAKAPDEVKEQATGRLNQLDALGKPLDIKFKAIDGRDVDLSALKGKVVLVDFWATWCGPCVAEIPNVKAAYEKLHDKGFEIVGISLDREKPALEEFVKTKSIPWVQSFDEGKIANKYGIEQIPTMWIVGKDGNLADMDGREDLAGKVEKLLAK